MEQRPPERALEVALLKKPEPEEVALPKKPDQRCVKKEENTMKRRMAALAIVGALSVAAIPASVFAAPIKGTDTTTVTYQVGGTPVTDDNTVVVYVPQSVALKSSGTAPLNLTIEVLGQDGYQTPDTSNPIGSDVAVTVKSTEGFKVVGQSTNTKAPYLYKVGGTTITNGSNAVGTFSDTRSVYALNGTVEFAAGSAPTTKDVYDDVLTFTMTPAGLGG